MDTLIQTGICSIIYGDFKGKPNQELFRCPRECDDTDLPRFINKNRNLIGFEDDTTENLENVEGKRLVDYWRMYYRGNWQGRWMSFEKTDIDELDCHGVNQIIAWLVETFPNGCDWKMKEYFRENFKESAKNRYLIKPKYSNVYKIMVDTTYGNEDYPVRIYVYKDKEDK